MSERITVDVSALAGAQTLEAAHEESVARMAIEVATRAGLTTEAAVKADLAADAAAHAASLIELDGINLKKLGSQIKAGVQKAASNIKAGVQKAAANVKAGVQKAAANIKASAQKTAANIKAGAKKVGDKLKKVGQAIKQTVSAMANEMKQRLKAFLHPTSGTPTEEQFTFFLLSRAIYNRPLVKAGQTTSISYQRACIDVKVLARAEGNGFLSWAVAVPAWNTVIAVFRGTKNSDNVKTDLNFIFTSCNFDGASCGHVHKGFYNDYNRVRGTIKAGLFAYLDSHKDITTIYTTGHSLGAAIAELAAFDLAHAVSKSRPSIKEVRSVNFGCPRPGDASFMKAWNAGFKGVTLASTRFAHWRHAKLLLLKITQYDPVAIIAPVIFGYNHVGTEFNIECKNCNSWLDLHKNDKYQATFTRLLGHDSQPQCAPTDEVIVTPTTAPPTTKAPTTKSPSTKKPTAKTSTTKSPKGKTVAKQGGKAGKSTHKAATRPVDKVTHAVKQAATNIKAGAQKAVHTAQQIGKQVQHAAASMVNAVKKHIAQPAHKAAAAPAPKPAAAPKAAAAPAPKPASLKRG